MSSFVKSMRNAIRGVRIAFCEESNMKVHAVAACLAITTGLVLRLSAIEMSLIVLCCAFVLYSEIINSACERLVDALHPKVSFHARSLKDIVAGSVLIASLSAAIIGVIIFTPALLKLIS